jgi:hypothetical protein
VTVYPYASQEGTIQVPDDIPEEKVGQYIHDHFNDIALGEVSLDYKGTDIEFDKE